MPAILSLPLLGCVAPTPPPAQDAPEVEILAASPADGIAPLGIGAIWSAAGEVWAAPALDPPLAVGGGGPRVYASTAGPGGRWIVLGGDGALREFDGTTLSASAFADLVPGPIRAILGAESELWLATDDGLWRWKDDRLAPYLLDGEPALAPFAAGCALEGDPVVWVTSPSGTWALAVDDGEVLAGVAWVADSLGCDATGALYATSEGALRWVLDGVVRAVEVGGPAGAAFTHPDARGAWVLTEAGAVRVDGAEISAPAEGVGRGAVDPFGRFLVASADGIARWSVGRPLVVVGVPEILGAPSSFTVVTTPSADVPALAATVTACTPAGDCSDAAIAGSEQAVVSLDEGGVGELDPARFPSGPLRLDVVATYAADLVSRRAVPFVAQVTDPTPVTWVDTIEPLYLDRCDVCHGGSTETRLDGKDLWIAKIDDVVREIEAGAMPLGGPRLTTVEGALVTTWRDAGFP